MNTDENNQLKTLYTFETVHDQKAFAALARGLRKTVRHRSSRRMRMFGWFVVIFGLLTSLLPRPEGHIVDFGRVVTWVALVIIVLTMIFEDNINGYFARRKLLAGTERAFTSFNKEGFISENKIGTSEFDYYNIQELAETKDYFIFIYDRNHAQVYDKRTITGGSPDEFRFFIESMTDISVESI